MKNLISKQNLRTILSLLASVLLLGACLHTGAIGLPQLVTSAKEVLPPSPVQWETARVVIDNRYVVCHGCFDAPCQLILSSPEGLDQGDFEDPVYQGTRLFASEPSRLFVDAQTTQAWRELGFYSVLENSANDQTNRVERMLELAATNSLPPGEKLPESVSLDIERKLTCPTPKSFGKYMKKHAFGGMPYATVPLTQGELLVLADWLATGAARSSPNPTLSPRAEQQVKDWEIFLNGLSLRQKFVGQIDHNKTPNPIERG